LITTATAANRSAGRKTPFRFQPASWLIFCRIFPRWASPFLKEKYNYMLLFIGASTFSVKQKTGFYDSSCRMDAGWPLNLAAHLRKVG
jgi:hypothetical protein